MSLKNHKKRDDKYHLSQNNLQVLLYKLENSQKVRSKYYPPWNSPWISLDEIGKS